MEDSTQSVPRKKKTTKKKQNNKISKKIANIFLECQKTISCHAKNVLKIQKKLGKDFESTKEQIIAHINGILAWPKKEISVDRLLVFISKLCGTMIRNNNKKNKKKKSKNDDDEEDEEDEEEDKEEEENFSILLLEHLLKNCNANNKTVRYRCTELISKLLPLFRPENIP